MPYIAQDSRIPYISSIDNAVKIICSEKDFRRAELLGHFTQEIFSEFSGINTGLDLNTFQELDKTSKLSEIVKTLTTRLLRDDVDMFTQSGELNYIISAVIYGVLGDSLHAGSSAKYGFRVFVKGILECLSSELDKRSNFRSRRDIFSKGIITDIIDEMYRRKTSSYEDEKIGSSGDLWPLKSVSFVESPAPYQKKSKDNFDEEDNFDEDINFEVEQAKTKYLTDDDDFLKSLQSLV